MTPNYSLLRQMREFCWQRDPAVMRALAPRRYVPPTGYCNPSLVTSILASHARFPSMAREQITKSMVDCALVAWRLAEESLPIYFVGRDFVEALTQSDPPADMTLSEIQWPFDAIQFYLPEAWAMQYFGRAVPYVSVARQPTGQLSPPRCLASLLPPTHSIGIELPPEAYDGDHSAFLTDAVVLFDEKPVDYASSWSMNQTVNSLLNESEFKDYTELDGTPIVKEGSHEEDLRIIHRVNALAIWLLMSMQASPEMIEPEALARPATVKRGTVVKEELWSPRWLGRRYAPSEPQGGTHASPRLHRRRGHFRWQAHGQARAERKLIWLKPQWIGVKVAA